MKKWITMVLFTAVMVLALWPAKASASEGGRKIYGIGSVSKVLGTAAVMKLVDRGKVNLDAPVTEYIPEFEMADERYRDITVRMLLNHSSGIMGTTYQGCFLLGKAEGDYHSVLLENLKTQRLKADPGEYSVYCNDGFTLAEILVERVSNMKFSAFVKKELTDPLNMGHTFMPAEIRKEDLLAPIFYKNRTLPYENIQSLASGGIYSTAEDLCRFSRIFTEKGAGILSQTSIDAMRAPEYKKNKICLKEGASNFNYGLGWDSVHTYPFSEYGITALTKGGDTGNYGAGLIVLPEQGISASVTASGGNSQYCLIMAEEIITEVLKEEGWITKEQEAEAARPGISKQEGTVPIPEELKKYAGAYASGEIWKLEFTEEDTARITSLENNREMVQEYVYTKEGNFVSTKGKYISYDGLTQTENGISGVTGFSFREEPNGKTYMMGTTYITAGGKANSAITVPFAEKIEANEIPDDVKRAWEARDGKKYYMVSEDYNSSYYLSQPSTKVELMEAWEGYTGSVEAAKNCRIVEENRAVCERDLPVMTGRDLRDYEFWQEGDIEYLDLGGYTFMDETSIPSLAGVKGRVSMGSCGQWYQIGNEEAGCELQITVPKRGSYFIFDDEDVCVASSLFTDEKDTVVLPKGGKVLLVGREGSVFTIVRG